MTRPRVGPGEVVREWGRIGIVGFGGPPAHVALLRDLTVERRGWLVALVSAVALALRRPPVPVLAAGALTGALLVLAFGLDISR